MAKKLTDFIKALIIKAGGNIEEEKIKAALATIDANTELQDELATAIDHGLISIANAKNNHPEIKNHYYAAAYNGLDTELDAFMQEEKLSEEVVNEIKGEKSSTKRAALLAKKIKELEAAKAGHGKAETKALNEKIAELNGLLRTEKDNVNTVKADYEKKLKDKDKGYAMRNHLSAYVTIYDKTLDAETKDITINAIIGKNLRAKGFELDTDENGSLILKTKDGSVAFAEDHTPLTAQKFLDKVMADEKLLVVSDSNQNQNNNRSNNQNNNSGGGSNNNRNNNNSGGFNNRNNNQNGNDQNNNNSGKSSVLKDLLKRSQDDLANASTNRVM